MFSTRKRIFAGKQALQPEPFCPYLTDANGYASLVRTFASPGPAKFSKPAQPIQRAFSQRPSSHRNTAPHRRPTLRDGNHHV